MSQSSDGHVELLQANSVRVARRALILAAIACRGSIDSNAGRIEAETLQTRILDWVAFLKLEDELDPHEKKILNTPLGKLESTEVIEATWSVEGLAVLAWALNQFELPRHDEKVDPYRLTDSLHFLSEDAAELIPSRRLRSTAELKAFRETIYAIHCRLRDFARNRQRKDFAAWVDREWIDVLKIDAAHLIVHGDLGIDDREISEAEQHNLQTCEWLTFRRHRAIVWLLGNHPVYSETPVDT
jgi:Domain of unknown function (DUF4272)